MQIGAEVVTRQYIRRHTILSVLFTVSGAI